MFILGVIICGLVWFLLKKNNQIKIKKKNKKTETEPEPKLVQTDRFQFGLFFRTKTDSNRFDSVFSGLARFFQFWLSFFCLARFWLGFFLIFLGLGSVRFFRFQA
jgi:hypothetical protein